jgi:hypothetical protein
VTAPEKRPLSTGAVDKDRRAKHNKMDRETSETNSSEIADGDLRGLGRQAKDADERQPEFDDVKRRNR